MMMNCFRAIVGERTAFTSCFQPGSFSEILSVANLRHAASKVESAQNTSSDYQES